jgi:hypothetical protein
VIDKQVFILVHPLARRNALEAVRTAPEGYCVEIKPKTRTIEQNSRLWAMLADVSRQVDWYGQKLSPEDWKHMFSAALKKQRAVPGIDGGFVILGQHTSKMTVREMRDLQELISAFGAERGVKFTEPQGWAA